MKVRDIIKEVESQGWYFHHQIGSHRQYHHPTLKGTVTIAGHPSDEVAKPTLGSIRKQAKGQ